ncbi:MAG: hypothetical protein GKS06_12955 [Acidobacteria bacterium]|nr:hypothetical protein [Acidobacteriota bacterium]
MSDAGYVLTEIWKPRAAWLALSKEERAAIFEQKVVPLLMDTFEKGGEVMTVAINDNDGAERIDYRYMAIWKFPNKAMSDELEASAKAAGFLDYFEQVNFSGTMMDPQALNADMIAFNG